jgi:hypothetical protein
MRAKRYGGQDDGSSVADHVRGFPHTWTVNDFGQAFGTEPATHWTRGELIQSFDQPLFAPPPLVPMYDPTIAAHPEVFRKPH